MNHIISGVKTIATTAATGIAVVGFVAIAPIVSLVALPIFAIKTKYAEIQQRSLYAKTLDKSHSRELHGRIKRQDYTSWIGATPCKDNRVENTDQYYYHGKPDTSFKNKLTFGNPFKTEEDLRWLQAEEAQLSKKEELEHNLYMVKVYAKCLIPVVGAIWYYWDRNERASQEKVGVSANTTWTKQDALKYHIQILKPKLILTLSFD